MITVDPFPGHLRGLDRALNRSTDSLQLDRAAESVELIGPMLAYTAHPVDFVETKGEKVEPSSWLGLAVSGDIPIAAIEIVSTEGAVNRYAVHGRQTTYALFVAMQAAQNYADARPQPYRARVLRLPSLFVSALWLDGRERAWIPFDEAAQDHETYPLPMDQARFLDLVRERLVQRTRSAPSDVDGAPDGAHFDDSSAPGPRLRNWRP